MRIILAIALAAAIGGPAVIGGPASAMDEQKINKKTHVVRVHKPPVPVESGTVGAAHDRGEKGDGGGAVGAGGGGGGSAGGAGKDSGGGGGKDK